MPNPPRRSRLAYYGELSQVGLEMVAPIALGALIDHWTVWTSPVCSIVGAVLGLVGGMWHLMNLANREDEIEDDPPKGPP